VANELLLIGSVPLDTAEAVFRTLGVPLGPYLAAMPDGELGERRWWVRRFAHQIFDGHPQIETLQRPPPEEMRMDRLVRRGRGTPWKFRLKPGVKDVVFREPGTGMGFTRDAVESYGVFRRLKSEGVLPRALRFQVSIPLPNSIASLSSFGLEDLAPMRAGLERALRAEVEEIGRRIPPEDLAIQWDGSWEVTDVYGAVPGMPPDGAVARNAAQVARLAPGVPERALLGYHLCFGTFGGWPRFAPPDLGRAVELANAMIEASGRRVDWINIPALDRLDRAFYAPLAALRPQGARVYLGLIHSMPTFKERLAVARAVLPEFGVAGYCGFGRIPASELPVILKDHLDAAAALKKPAP